KGPWKWRARGRSGKAKAAFPLLPPSLGNLAKGARFPHSHRPACGHGKVENQKQVSHFPTSRSQRRRLLFENRKPKTKEEVGRCAPSACSDFRIILYWKPNSISGSFFD